MIQKNKANCEHGGLIVITVSSLNYKKKKYGH